MRFELDQLLSFVAILLVSELLGQGDCDQSYEQAKRNHRPVPLENHSPIDVEQGHYGLEHRIYHGEAVVELEGAEQSERVDHDHRQAEENSVE